MQKTSTGKKIFITNISQRPSLALSKSIEKHLSSKNIQRQHINEEVIQQNTEEKNKNPRFQYYFFQKHKSQKLLKNLRNNPYVKKICEKQKLKQQSLDNQLKELKHKITNQISNDQIPFYKKLKPQLIQNDPQLSEYGLFYNKIKQQTKKTFNHKFQKVRQNKHNLSKYKSTKGMISPQRVKTQLSIDIQLNERKKLSSSYNLGLSPFQYKNTISGRLQTFSSHDLRMDLNKTYKTVNIQKIWYNTNQQVEKNHKEFKNIRQTVENDQKIKKCRSFDNYKGHKLFQSKIKKSKQADNDHFYDAKGDAKNMSFYQRWKTQNHIDMGKITDRPEYPERLGPNLNVDLSKRNLKPCSKKNQIGFSSSQRNLIFSRQIINSARGCYR